MNRLRNALYGIAYDNAQAIAQPGFGVIVSVDPLRGMARVVMQPDGVLSGWLPVGTPIPGWQMLPPVGQQAVIVPVDGDKQNGVIVAFAYSNPNPPPQVPNAPGGGNVPLAGTEQVLTGPGGSALRFCADGSVYVQGALKLAGNVSVTGNITATGSITAGLGGADQIGLQTHMHPGTNTAPTAGT